MNTVIACTYIYIVKRIKVILNPCVFMEYQEASPTHTCTLTVQYPPVTPVLVHFQIAFILSKLLKNCCFMKSCPRERGHAKIEVFWKLAAIPRDMLHWMPSLGNAPFLQNKLRCPPAQSPRHHNILHNSSLQPLAGTQLC